MTITQVVLFVGVLPTVTALVGIIMRRRDLNAFRRDLREIGDLGGDLRSEIRDFRRAMVARFDALPLISKSVRSRARSLGLIL